GVRDAQLHNSLRFVTAAVEFFGQIERNGGSARDRESFHLGGIGNGHDAGDNRHGDAYLARVLDEIEVAPVIEEELRDHKIQTLIDLALEVYQVYLRIAALGVLFGITGAAQAERRRSEEHTSELQS